MSTSLSIDRRISLCTFTFADGRRCRMPHCAAHPELCTYHARKESQTRAAEKAGRDIAYDLSGSVATASDLTSALRHLFSAVAQGHIKPKTANTLAYLAQTLVQSIQLSHQEYIATFGEDAWNEEVESHLYPDEDEPQPAQLPSPTPPPAAPPHDTQTHESEDSQPETETEPPAEPEPTDETTQNDASDQNDESAPQDGLSATEPAPDPHPNPQCAAQQGGNYLANKPLC